MDDWDLHLCAQPLQINFLINLQICALECWVKESTPSTQFLGIVKLERNKITQQNHLADSTQYLITKPF